MKSLQIITACGLVALSLTACVGKTTTPNTQAKPIISKQNPAKASGVWIDVRSPEEYQAGHISGAINITNDNLAERIASVEPNKNAPINLYCRSGRRAEVGRKILMDLGYTNVTNHGGYEDLIKKGIQ